MAFVNEYISEEDIEKYGIREVWSEYHPFIKNSTKKYSWTIDRTKDVFFIPAKTGREELSNEKICILWWKGFYLSVTLANVGGDLDFSARIGSVIWELRDIWKPKNFLVPDNEIISVLKEALIAYQFDGIVHPMTDYKVNFSF